MFRAIFTNSFGILFSRVLGFIRDLLTASILGANIYSDIFFIAFKLPNLFRRIFAEGAFTQVFIPSYAKSKHKSLFSAYVLVLFLTIILTLTLLVNIAPNLATKAIAVGFNTNTIDIAAPYVAINFWYLPLIFGVTFLSALLQYKNHFATTAFATALLNISLILALYLSKDKTQSEIVYYLSYGVVTGGILQLVTHLIVLHKLGLSKSIVGGFLYLKKDLYKIKTQASIFKRLFIPAIWGNSTAQISAFLDTWLASFLVTGSISYLYYANRVFQLPLALFAIATSVALFPRVAKHIKNAQEDQALSFMSKAFWFLATILTLSMLGGYILSDEIVYILFQRGAFVHEDTLNTAYVLEMYLLGLLPFGLQKLLSLWLYAHEMQSDAAKIATYSLTTNIILSLLLISPMGAAGLALASSISGFVGFGMTLKFFGKKNFLAILSLKKMLYLVFGSLVFSVLVFIFKDFISVYI